jgi:hypothetical protein
MALGMRRDKIAQQVGYYPTTISVIARSAAFQERLAELRREIQTAVVTALVNQITSRSIRG